MGKQKSPTKGKTVRKPPTLTIEQVCKKIGAGVMEVFRRANRLANAGRLDLQQVREDFRAYKAGQALASYVREFLRKFTDGDPEALAA